MFVKYWNIGLRSQQRFKREAHNILPDKIN